MNYTLVLILGYSVVVPAVLAVIRFNRINKIYFPFLFCIWIALVNELLNSFLIHVLRISNAVNTDIYCLIEALLYTWLFRNFNLFSHRKIYFLLIGFLCTAWLIDNLIISRITLFDSYFTILYSLIIVLMSITLINRLIVREINLLVNPVFLICAAFTIYFFLLGLVEIFWLYGLNSSKAFRLHIYRIMAYVNVTVNLIFALSIVWMHKKQEFIPQ